MGAIYLADEILLREPALLVPRRHPLGRVKIDWRHPYTEAIVGCWPLFYGTPNFIPDLSRYGKHGVQNGVDITRETGITGRHLANYVDASNDELDLGTITPNDDPLGCTRLNEVSVFAYAQLPLDQNNTFPRLVSKESAGAGTGGYSFSMRTTSATAPNDCLQFSVGGTNLNSGTNTLGTAFTDYSGLWGGMGATSRSGNTDFFWRGRHLGNDTASYTMGTSNVQMGLLGATYASDRNWNAGAQFVCIWDEKVPDEWMIDLCHDPYQFLVPA